MLENRKERDPVKRRQEIVEAAVAVIIAKGVAGLTHRAVANESELALGTITRHYPKIADLREATFAYVGEETEVFLNQIEQELAKSTSPQKTLAKLMHDYLLDIKQVNSSVALMNEVATDPTLRVIAQRFSDGFVEILEAYTDTFQARALETYFEGAMIHAAIYGTPLTEETLLRTITIFFESVK